MPRDIAGEVFYDLTAIRPSGTRIHRSPGWVCRCVCGVEKMASYNQLTTGNTKSCGCRVSRVTRAKNIASKRHGHASTHHATPTYRTWTSMLSRCHNEDADNYDLYGGRGISVCERWMTFDNFLEDMGVRPHGTTLDRIDVDGHYELTNCRWATNKQQCRNTRSNINLTHDGVTRCVSEWAEVLGVKVSCLRMRLNKGWSVERALTTPVEKRKTRGKVGSCPVK
jgi:hypothetical protein